MNIYLYLLKIYRYLDIEKYHSSDVDDAAAFFLLAHFVNINLHSKLYLHMLLMQLFRYL